MKRRDFLVTMAGITVMTARSLKKETEASRALPTTTLPATGHTTRVFLAGTNRGDSEQMMKLAVRAAAEAATNFSWLSKGDVVFIKPTLNSGNPYPATTSPIAIRAIIELLREKGAARVIVGDMAGIQRVKLSPNGLRGSSRRLMEASGMARAAQAAGGELFFFEEAGWKAFYEDAPTAGSHWKRGLMMPNILREVEHVILMPRCARHGLAGSTLGLKAAVGYWRTDTRLEYHHDASTFQEKTAEGNTVSTLLRKQRLVISAADKILTTFGPDKGYVTQPDNGLVISSESVVAHDMVSLAWLLEHWHGLSLSCKSGLKDPYNRQLAVSIGNKWIVDKLGGWRTALASERLTRNDINIIWDDRTLNQAYQVFGGMPLVTLDAANNVLPEDLKKRLSKMITVGA
jgi:uncharacterized protein (DUF362 family)